MEFNPNESELFQTNLRNFLNLVWCKSVKNQSKKSKSCFSKTFVRLLLRMPSLRIKNNYSIQNVICWKKEKDWEWIGNDRYCLSLHRFKSTKTLSISIRSSLFLHLFSATSLGKIPISCRCYTSFRNILKKSIV